MVISALLYARQSSVRAQHSGLMENGRPLGSSPFARAYAHLRTALVAGDHSPGSRLKVGDIARELCLSPTPVREALATLSGEAIVGRHRDAGYFVPRPDADEIANLYAFEAQCLSGRAIARHPPAHVGEASMKGVAGRSVDDVRSLTEWLATSLGNPVLLTTIQLINDRLSAARRAEAMIWPLEELESIWTTSQRDALVARRAVTIHLRRCMHRAREIAALANRDNIVPI